ncbi:MAG: MgtC/SapB family protein [Acidobacteria bacterium]|nr:MgtC/SapB family protein [Acidobacteriota bacterium]
MNPDIVGLLVAALGGAAIGVERQHSGHASGPHARFGGIRTFTLLGGVSGIAGYLSTADANGLAITVVAAACALIITGYAAASRREVEATTEMAALVVIAAGVLAGRGEIALTSGIIAVTALLLAEKSRLHRLVERLDDTELKAAVRFAVMATVILPLLPEGPYGPLGGFRPRTLWMVVLLFSALSFIGYIARRLTHGTTGYPLSGLLGGIVSSTAVTFSFSRLSRLEPESQRALAIGTLAASTMLYPRLAVAMAVLNLRVASDLVWYLLVPFVAGVISLIVVRNSHGAAVTPQATGNPLQLLPAIQMALAFQVVLFATAWVRVSFGSRGLMTSGALLGLAEMDALAYSMATLERLGTDAHLAARAVVAGVAANSWMKLAVAAVLGGPEFRRVALPWMALTAGVATAVAFL